MTNSSSMLSFPSLSSSERGNDLDRKRRLPAWKSSCYTDFMIHFSGDDESLTDRCCVGKRRIGDLEKTWSMEIFGIFKKMDCKGGVLGITVCRWDKLA